MISYRLLLKLLATIILLMLFFLNIVIPISQVQKKNLQILGVSSLQVENEIAELQTLISEQEKYLNLTDTLQNNDVLTTYSKLFGTIKEFGFNVKNIQKQEDSHKSYKKYTFETQVSGSLRMILRLINHLENESSVNSFQKLHIYQDKSSSKVICSFSLSYFSKE